MPKKESPIYTLANFKSVKHVKCRKCGADCLLVNKTGTRGLYSKWFTISPRVVDGVVVPDSFVWHDCAT